MGARAKTWVGVRAKAWVVANLGRYKRGEGVGGKSGKGNRFGQG